MTDSQFIGNTNMRISMLEKQVEAIIQDLEQIKYAINNHSEYIKAIIDTLTGKTETNSEEEIENDDEVRLAAESEADSLFEDIPEEYRESAEEDFYEGKD